MAVAVKPEDVIGEFSAGARKAPARAMPMPTELDSQFAALFTELLDQWRDQLAELSVKS